MATVGIAGLLLQRQQLEAATPKGWAKVKAGISALTLVVMCCAIVATKAARLCAYAGSKRAPHVPRLLAVTVVRKAWMMR